MRSDWEILRRHVGLVTLLSLIISAPMLTSTIAWSRDGHRAISTLACEFLPESWRHFFQYYGWLLNETAEYPDLYREMDPNEPRHTIDLEVWDPNDSSTGTLPQAISKLTSKMESAIRSGQWNDMFLDAGRVAHYAGDLANPYHTTADHNPVGPNGVGLHGVLDSALADHWSELNLLTPYDVEPLTPITNSTRFILDLAWQSHSFLSVINRMLIRERLQWSPELTRIIENRTNTAILALSRIWYTAISDVKLPPPDLPQPNSLSIHIEYISLNASGVSTIRLNVIDLLGVKTYANVLLRVGASVFRGQVADVVPPVGEYVIILDPGNYLSNFTLTAQRIGYRMGVARIVVGIRATDSTYTAQSTIPAASVHPSSGMTIWSPSQTIAGVLLMIIALVALLANVKRTKVT